MKIGCLTVLRRLKRLPTKKRVYWVCQCDCGEVIKILHETLLYQYKTHGVAFCNACKPENPIHRKPKIVKPVIIKGESRGTAIKSLKPHFSGSKALKQVKLLRAANYKLSEIAELLEISIEEVKENLKN